MTEKEFLIYLAVDNYNRQYNKNYDVADFDIRSIAHNDFTDIAYEVYTSITNDNLRLRMYMTFADSMQLTKYRIETRSPDSITSSEDEVYVASGNLDEQYIWNGTYRFREIPVDDDLGFMILTEDDLPLDTEIGTPFILELNSQ